MFVAEENTELPKPDFRIIDPNAQRPQLDNPLIEISESKNVKPKPDLSGYSNHTPEAPIIDSSGGVTAIDLKFKSPIKPSKN